MEQDSVFEVASGAEEILVPNISKSEYKGRPIRCVQEQDPQHGAGPREGGHRDRSTREFMGRHGDFRKKKPFHRGQGPR
jgi:hypothetical protein